MCFNNDFEWYAEVHEESDASEDRESKCFECGDTIPSGAMRRRIYQQEYEECRRCELEELEPDEEPCVHHDYGEEFTCDICMSCAKLLTAIEAVESEEGCPPGKRQPAYGELWEEMTMGNCAAYLKRTWDMFPELLGTRWSERIERRVRS